MENNNAIAVQGPDAGEARIEDVKPVIVDDGDAPKKEGRGQGRRLGRRRDEIPVEDETGKWAVRRKVWDHLEDNNLVNAPRPCHYRIPNFEGAAQANDKLPAMEVFKKARTVKINPDKPQEQARFLVLESQKNLLVPTPQLRTGLLNRVLPPIDANKEQMRHCCTSQGVKENSKEIGLEDKVKIDLVVVGSVAVSRSGLRIGKGKGFADLEYAMLRTMGAIDASTPVITSVHDSQVMDIDEDLIEDHDLVVDYILTPTELIETKCSRKKPEGVIWSKLEIGKFYQIPVLKQLREIEREQGKPVMLKGQEPDDADPVDNMAPPRPRRYNRYNNRGGGFRGGYRGGRGGYRRGGSRRRVTDGDDSNKENDQTGEESGPDGDAREDRGNRRGYRGGYRRYRRGGRRSRASESELTDDGGEVGQGDADDKPRQRRFNNRRPRFPRRRRFEGNRRNDSRGDQSGSDGEQRTSGDEDEGRRRPQRPRFRTNPDAVVFVGALSRRLRVSELKSELRSQNVNPVRLVWHGGRGFCFLHFQTEDNAKTCVSSLQGKEFDGREIKVEMASNDRPRRRREGSDRAGGQATDAADADDR